MHIRRISLAGAILGFLLLVLAACSSQVKPTPAPTQPPTALLRYKGEHFSTSGECAYCHTGLTDSTGSNVSFDQLWRSTMMANSSRDPYYRASVRSETLIHPEHKEVIEKKCSVCHIGMAFHETLQNDLKIKMLPDEGFLAESHPYYPLALDGVSCSLCHQIQDGNLGKEDSFSGEYLVDQTLPEGEREAFGYFEPEPAMIPVMQNASGFKPVAAAYVKESEICAVCHNLFTPYIDNQGNLSTELFPEQTPHLEWLQSSLSQTSSCQTCHMPAASSEVALANTGSPKRSPFPKHEFVGGNRYMLSILASHQEALKASAEVSQFEQTISLTEQQLQELTANLNASGTFENGTLFIDVDIENLTGHKFPTSFPSRRAWLHVLVKDETGEVVFESGQWTADGAILGNANDANDLEFEPHYTTIRLPDQVQIYEAIIGDPDGQVTTTLLRAKSYLKDNRLLPPGFDKDLAPNEVGVFGEAVNDPDFRGGSDKIQYEIKVAPDGRYTIEIELLYQSIGFRWAEKFKGQNSPEGTEFYNYTKDTPNTPVVVQSLTTTIP